MDAILSLENHLLVNERKRPDLAHLIEEVRVEKEAGRLGSQSS